MTQSRVGVAGGLLVYLTYYRSILFYLTLQILACLSVCLSACLSVWPSGKSVRTPAALELMRQRPSLDLSPQPLGSELS